LTGRRRNPVRTFFKCANLTPNSVVIIKIGSIMDNKKQMGALANELVKRDLRTVIMLRLPTLDEINVLDEKEMNQIGWFKKEVPNAEPKPA
jgi:hypothetical protein